MLEIKDVVAGYLPDVNVLQGVSIQVGKGELVCMIGPNGAGKSTVLRAISGILKPTQGSIVFDGENISGLRPDLVLKYGIAHVPQGHSAFPEMTVKENLLMGGYVLKSSAERNKRIDKVYEMFPLLAERQNEKAGNFSGGQQKILEMGRAMMLEPKMMLLDEPSLGLAPLTARQVFDTIKSLKEDMGMTVLMVEQNAKSGLAISDRAYVLELGIERLEGPAKTLLNDSRVAELYLGGTLSS
ncbi:MAG: ABC transporter ATP-binding protein [Anaerolineae bacterium]|nr:ABC transporter ATP-binding protein [Anaerolineae bacterium]